MYYMSKLYYKYLYDYGYKVSSRPSKAPAAVAVAFYIDQQVGTVL